MSWTSIVSYVSFKEIAEIFDVETNTEFVENGILTDEGINHVFEEVSDYCIEYKRKNKVEITEELRLKKENSFITKLVSAYISPENLVKKINWIDKFQFINQYAKAGTRLPFLDTPKGEALIWIEEPEGFMLTIFPPIMTFVNDMQYQEDSTLPEFNFDDVTAYDVISALEQAIKLELCQVEKELKEFVY